MIPFLLCSLPSCFFFFLLSLYFTVNIFWTSFSTWLAYAYVRGSKWRVGSLIFPYPHNMHATCIHHEPTDVITSVFQKGSHDWWNKIRTPLFHSLEFCSMCIRCVWTWTRSHDWNHWLGRGWFEVVVFLINMKTPQFVKIIRTSPILVQSSLMSKA